MSETLMDAGRGSQGLGRRVALAHFQIGFGQGFQGFHGLGRIFEPLEGIQQVQINGHGGFVFMQTPPSLGDFLVQGNKADIVGRLVANAIGIFEVADGHGEILARQTDIPQLVRGVGHALFIAAFFEAQPGVVKRIGGLGQFVALQKLLTLFILRLVRVERFFFGCCCVDGVPFFGWQRVHGLILLPV